MYDVGVFETSNYIVLEKIDWEVNKLKNMNPKIRIALGQINPTVGDFSGNLKKIKEMTMEARKSGAAIIVFPELSISGSPPEDLLFKRLFIQECKAALHKAASYSNDIAIIEIELPPPKKKKKSL